ncbi:MAG: hypothetical protein ACPLW7_01005, partial [Minisyncoccia bacterium]
MINFLTKNKIAIFALLFILIITNYHPSLVFADTSEKLGDRLSKALNNIDTTQYNCHCDKLESLDGLTVPAQPSTSTTDQLSLIGDSPRCLSICCTLNIINNDRKKDLIEVLNGTSTKKITDVKNEIGKYLGQNLNNGIKYCVNDDKYTLDQKSSYSMLSYDLFTSNRFEDAINLINTYYTKGASVSNCKSHSDANDWTTKLVGSLKAYAESKNITCASSIDYNKIEDNWNCLQTITTQVCNEEPDSQLCKALNNYIKCPKEDNYNVASPLIGPFITKLVLQYEAQPSPDEDNCLIQLAKFNLFDIVLLGFRINHIIIHAFAGIALGIRAIVGYVANAFVWSFVGLPQKLGGYVHFTPIYDPNTKTGVWYTILIFANLGIIIGMIFMAIATILGIEKYSWKKMLPKLFLVALLVNFSLIILGIFVDISNYLSMTFLAQSTNLKLGDTIKDVITAVSCPLAGDMRHFVPDMTAVIVAIILSGVFLFQFIGLLFYVITRIFTIWICVATSPLAFLGMAIDAGPINNAVRLWRDRFTQAIVSLPILSFFLYFILLLLKGIGNQINEIAAKSNNALNFPMLIAYAVLIIGAAQVLRFVAQSIGIEQVEKGFQFAKKLTTDAVAAAGG